MSSELPVLNGGSPCPNCGRPTADGQLCEACAPAEATEPLPELPDPIPYAVRARYMRAAFWGTLLAFPLIAWVGIAPLRCLSRLLENGTYPMQWYEWYTLPGQAGAVLAYSWALAYVHRWARAYERMSAWLCARCSFPLVGGATRCGNCGAEYDPRLAGEPPAK